jgi:uncharacterized 2Fe-2S/4Fe-4S cluster protein (DUF4445 family)
LDNNCQRNCIECGICTQSAILDEFNLHGDKFKPRKGCGIAIDIGTTTVVIALVDLSKGTLLARHSFLNPQRKFGPDVITRIEAAIKGNLEELCSLIRMKISEGIKEIIDSENIAPDQVVEISIACNTVMAYLLVGLPCDSLGLAPFKPAFELESLYESRDLFKNSAVNCMVRVIPFLGAFVGGDVTAGLAYLLPAKKQCFMLVDLGTNGEVALYDKKSLTVTATAAGPAFEQPVMAAKDTFRGASEVIGALAELVRKGEVNKRGVPKNEDVFSRKQIGDIQLAKSAIRSGIEILLEINELTSDNLDAIYLAGGIGQAMDVNDAVDIGLLPNELKNKAIPAGNTSLGGAAEILRMPERAQENISDFFSTVKEVNLATDARFSRYFMKHITF